MNSFELNKILGAVLFIGLCVLGLNITAGAIFSPVHPEKPGFDVAVKETPAAGQPSAKEPEKPIAALLADSSAEKGKTAARKCEACHTFNNGGANKVGPNLWEIVGRKVASHAGFDYSAAMKSKGGEWTFEALNTYLRNPKADVPGTKMAFAGISRDSERADVIHYLQTLADNPRPLPKVAAAPAPAGGQQQGAAPAGGAPQGQQPGATPQAAPQGQPPAAPPAAQPRQ
jgi:cytochrome c